MYILIVAAVLVVLNTYPLIVTRDFIFESKHSTLKSQAQLIGSSLEELDALTGDNIGLVMEMLKIDSLSAVIVTDEEGNIIYNDIDEGYDLTYRYRWSIQQALERNDAYYSAFKDGAFTTVYSVPLINAGNIIGTVCIVNYDVVQGGVVTALRNNLVRITIAISVLSVIVSALFTQRITSKLRKMLEGIRSVRHGEYNYRIDIKGHDEISVLGEEFNSLVDRLQRTEEIRRRFVSDASHELKTPLASIQLLSDSLVQNKITDMDTVTEFASDIGDEARRLARTTEKLLRLTNLDNNIMPEYGVEDLADIAKRAVKMLMPIAEERKVEIETDLEGGSTIFASQDDMFQIVINLVENAIKYNIENGSVFVGVKRAKEKVVLTVTDTGVGIPEVDLPLIFDRFYRVDKARSRADGGSGLGLSIVKSTTEQYGGTIKAERRLEGGMKFVVTFDYYDAEKNFDK